MSDVVTVTPDIVLSDGREITFDLGQMTISDYRALFDKKQSPADEDVTMARVSGLTLEEYRALPYPDWRRLTVAFFDAARRPVEVPNLVSASGST